MAITSQSVLQSCLVKRVEYSKLDKTSNIQTIWQTLFAVGTGGTPADGTLNVGNTTTGVVPSGATDTGYPPISTVAFGAGQLAYFTRAEYHTDLSAGSGTVSKIRVYDRLFVAGQFAFNAATSLSSQPSFASRLPFKSDGSTVDYTGIEIWAETTSTWTGTQSFTVTYTNQAGTAGQTTGAIAAPQSALPIGGCWQLPLAAGDTGVQKIESVTGSVGSAGNGNIMILRPLCELVKIGRPNEPATLDYAQLGMVQVFYDTALYPLCQVNQQTHTGLNALYFEFSVG